MARSFQPPKKRELLREAAILLAQGQIDPEKPETWHQHLDGPPKRILGAMALAMLARERAGSTHVSLVAGEVAVHSVTTTGANVITTTAPRKSDTDLLQFAAIIGDRKGPINGMAIRIDTYPGGSTYEVTDHLGKIEARVAGLAVELVLGTPAIDNSVPHGETT